MPCCPIDKSGKAAVVVTLGNKDRQQLTLPTKTRMDTIDGQLKRGKGGQSARTVNRPRDAEREMEDWAQSQRSVKREMPLSQKRDLTLPAICLREATTADGVCCCFTSSDHFKITRHAMATLLPFILPLRPSKNVFQHARCISTTAACYSRAVKKRITRLKSDHYAYPEDVSTGKQGPNDNPSLTLVNRNPRNLEQLHREIKPLGWELETPTRVYWNK